ncbi:dTMP kinase [bacterium]|nr:dTMP kinase [bacterium]
MRRNSYLGKFIVFEGIDGSGKATQTKLLVERLKQKGYKVSMIDFPQYGSKSVGLVEEYLKGKYGSSEDVGPYRASLFYACDRYDGSFKIREWLKQGRVVVADRYIGSNIAHQGGKIKSKQGRKKFLKWLYNLEYKIFAIPKPDITLILKTSPSLAKKMATRITDKRKIRKRNYLGKKRRDIHEKSLRHLSNAFRAYLEAAEEFPKDFQIIECLENKKLLPPPTIHQKVWRKIQGIL